VGVRAHAYGEKGAGFALRGSAMIKVEEQRNKKTYTSYVDLDAT